MDGKGILSIYLIDKQLLTINGRLDMKQKYEWEEVSNATKIRLIARLGLSLVVLIISLAGIFGFLDSSYTNKIAMPLLAIVMVLTGIEDYKTHDFLAYFSFGVLVLIFVISLSIFYLT